MNLFTKTSIVLSSLLYTVAFAQTPQKKEEQGIALENVVVKGRATEFYLEKTTDIGSKTDIDIMSLPQSVQILNEQLIHDQAARDITDLYRSIAGVSEFSYSGVTFRGFRDSGNVFYDGVRGDPYSGFSVPQLFNVERVEVLKGPAAALYGNGEPSGMINYVTKKPSFDTENKVGLTLGNYDLRGAHFDSRGGLSEKIAYRLGVFFEEQDSFRNNADEQNIEISGGLLFELSENTDLTTTFDYIKQDLGGHRLRGVPVDDNGNFLVDRSYNANEKGDYQKLKATVFQASLDHKFNNNFSVKTTVRYLDNQRDQGYHESRHWVDVNGDDEANIDDGTIKREYRLQDRSNEEISLTTDFTYLLEARNIDHQLLFGFDYHKVDTDFINFRARYEGDNVKNLNIFDLNYGETDPSTYTLLDRNGAGSKATRTGIYLQDKIDINEHWILLGGFRFDQFNDEASGYEFDDSHISPRLGLTYKIDNLASVYLNYSESFKPTSLGNQEDVEGDGATLDPERGTQIELGLKKLWMGGKIMTTFAAYQINKKDLAINNPDKKDDDDGIASKVNLGEVESQGFEMTLVGDITNNWTMTANYAYNDTIVKEGVGQIRNDFGEGERFTNAPEHQAGIWTRYDINNLNSAVAFGANYVSEQMSFDSQKVKPFTVFDASWTTTWDATQVQVNIHNLFDKEYAVSGFNERNGHFPGAPREFVVQLTHNF